ncbi:hypothetical protein CO174_03755 [Candidatus Uhrbacteria bacterium CG_4_9_14_3_um_filter_50_9]|uniref:VWFA domain-containing protein n=1 Tax=Candidatus Uhrbacteria bacterium CG_4_9_14_3_um_filter_50_9 TaxID=1975035 RepID=A0A2M7XBY2_9BACT|nr:MAG: hypothetical protein CO174_03755 [Candidatus Uhrbacteria bacterium CG_4_9_14_3_um_filter_50_9]
MSESSDYGETNWDHGHTFGQERHTYRARADRSYGEAKQRGVEDYDLLPEQIVVTCTRLLLLSLDVTGSMGDWPPIVFDKAPYLQYEIKYYTGDDGQICVSAFGDAVKGEDFALQMRPPATGTEVKNRINELKHTNMGGNNKMESSDLALLYASRNIEHPLGAKPILIIVTDEAPHDQVTSALAKKHARVDMTSTLCVEDVIKEAAQKYDIYVILKPYGSEDRGDYYSTIIQNRWIGLVGRDHIANLSEAERVVDVIFGILGAATNKIDYFLTEIRGRQRPEQVDVVLEALKHIFTDKAIGPKAGERVNNEEVDDDVGPLL